MSFLDTVARAKTYLREHGRVSLRALRLEFELSDEELEALVEELVDVQQVAISAPAPVVTIRAGPNCRSMFTSSSRPADTADHTPL